MKKVDLEEKLKVFGGRLKFLREEKGWTQEELANKLGCSKGLISFYENAKREPGFTIILGLSRLFNEDPSFLMGEARVRRLKKIAQ